MMSATLFYIAMTVMCNVQVHASVHRTWNENNLEVCPKSVWTIAPIDEDPGVWHGNTLIEFQLPAAEKVATRYEAILACEGIIINGTGHQILRVKKGQKQLAQFRLHLPVPKDGADSILYGKDLNHSCTYEVRDVSKYSAPLREASVVTQCAVRVRTYLNRILPTCDYERSKKLIDEIEVSKEQGQVQIYLKQSANDVFTADHDCHHGNILGHNRSKTMEAEVFPLRPPGTENSAMLIAFYPSCETYNDSVREHFTHKRMDDCHLEIFSLCQDGFISISETKIDFDDDAMLCYPPKPAYIEALEGLELKFRIESLPIVGLLCLLIVNGGLYLSIVPFAITRSVRCVVKRLRYVEKKLANSKKRKDPPPASTTGSSPPSMEFDDVETTLFDKLSNNDLVTVTSSRAESIPTQVEVTVEVEVVNEQPRIEESAVDEEDISPLQPRESARKRKHSVDHKKSHQEARHRSKRSHDMHRDNPPVSSPPLAATSTRTVQSAAPTSESTT